MADSNDLSEREREILRLVATGAGNKQIAQQLGISTNTVKVHIKNIFAKVGATSRTEAAMHAVRIGLVETLSQQGAVPGAEEPVERDTEDVELSQADLLPVSQVLPDRAPSFRWWWLGVIFLVTVMIGLGGYFLGRDILDAQIQSPSTQGLGEPTEKGWQAKAKLPTARWGLATCTYEGDIFAIGGENGNEVLGINERYKAATDMWETRSRKPTPVTDVQAVLLGGKIYLPGGRLADGRVTPILEVYDPRADSWETGASMPVGLSAYAMVSFEGKLFLLGGWNGKQYVNTVYAYDPSLDTWDILTPMPTARGYAAAAVADGKMIVMGGYDGQSALDTNEIYQPDLEGIEPPWSSAAPLPLGRYGMGLATAADIIHVVGGIADAQEDLPSLIYFPQRDEWQQFEIPLRPQPRGKLSLVFLDRHIYVIGGLVNNAPTDLVQTYQVIYSVAIPMIR